MSILYIDCRLGITERTLFAGLLDLGLSPSVLNVVPELLKQSTEELIGAFQENRLGECLLKEERRNSPIIQLNQVLALLKTSHLPVEIREETRQILALATGHSELKVTNTILSVEGVLLLIGTMYGLKELKIENLFSSPLPLSIPDTRTELLKILQDGNVPLTPPITSSRLTLLSAALLAHKATFRQPDLCITRVSQVTQHIDQEDRVAMRLILGETTSTTQENSMCQIQTNLDDITPQQLAYVIKKLTDMGALETYQIPVGIKKNRLGYQLNAVVNAQDEARIVAAIFRETPTLGVRIFHVDNHFMASYEIQQISTAYGIIPIKLKLLDGRVVGMQPEYEVCVQKATEFDLSFQQIYSAACAAAYERNFERLKNKP